MNAIAVSRYPSKALHISLWIAQSLLAAMFLMAGAMKSFQPIDQIAQSIPWAPQVPEALVRFIGISELLGALGLVLPSATRIQPNLTAVAAFSLTVVMVLAAGFHAMRGEYPGIGVNVVLGGLTLFVGWGRWSAAPIAPRGR